jgi:hypothetical protein
MASSGLRRHFQKPCHLTRVRAARASARARLRSDVTARCERKFAAISRCRSKVDSMNGRAERNLRPSRKHRINLMIREKILSTMNSKTAKSRIAARIALILLLSLLLLVFSALAYDFVGTVEKVSEPNGMTVNVTQPGTYGLQAKVEVLLDKPLADLTCFKGKELQFEILGHDILDRPVCEAYLDGIDIRYVYYCRQNPVDSSYCRNCLASEWTGRYLDTPCYEQCRSYYPSF